MGKKVSAPHLAVCLVTLLCLIPAAMAALPQDEAKPGWVPYMDELAPYLNAPYLTESQRSRAADYHLVCTTLAELNAGKIPENIFKIASDLEKSFTARAVEYQLILANPFHAMALRQGQQLKRLARDTFLRARRLVAAEVATNPHMNEWIKANLREVPAATFTLVYEPPFIISVQDDSGWDEVVVGRRQGVAMQALHEAIVRELKPPRPWSAIRRPVRVVLLRDETGFRQFNWGHFQTLALARRVGYFDPEANIIVLRASSSFRTAFYPTALFFLDAYAAGSTEETRLTPWLRHGLATWFWAAQRDVSAERSAWKYSFGALDRRPWRIVPRIGNLHGERPRPDLFDLKTLLTVGASELGSPLKLTAARMITYLRDFDVDQEGYVKFGDSPGKYRAAWQRYLRLALAGIGDLDTFRATFGLDTEEKFAAMASEFRLYCRWIERKININQVKDGRLIPALEWRTRRGKLAGLREDDRLIQ